MEPDSDKHGKNNTNPDPDVFLHPGSIEGVHTQDKGKKPLSSAEKSYLSTLAKILARRILIEAGLASEEEILFWD